jgi:Fic family protein
MLPTGSRLPAKDPRLVLGELQEGSWRTVEVSPHVLLDDRGGTAREVRPWVHELPSRKSVFGERGAVDCVGSIPALYDRPTFTDCDSLSDHRRRFDISDEKHFVRYRYIPRAHIGYSNSMPIPISIADLPPVIWERVRSSFHALDAHRPLPNDVGKVLRDQLRILHTYHSNAIEGNSLTLKETRLVLEEGLTIGGKSLRDHLEATNNAKAFEWVWDLAKPRLRFDHPLLQQLHEIITRGILESAGRYRREQVWIGGARHVPPQPAKIVPLLDALFAELPAIQEPVLRSIYLHHRLAYVHPFLDGNGRVARLAANLALMSARYPPIVLRVSDRLRYYRHLQAADDGDLRPFAGFVLRALDESLTGFLAALEPERALVPLRVLAKGSPYTQEYLSLRARQSILAAVKIEGNWYSSAKALSEYQKKFGRNP